jgi:hypothetical protein
MAVKRLGVFGLQRQCAVIGGECLLEAAKRGQDQAVIVMGRRYAGAGRDRGADQLERLVALAALVHQHAAKMKRVKMIRHGVQDLPVERFGLAQLSALMVSGGLAQQRTEIRLRGSRPGFRDGHGPPGVAGK